MKEVRRTRERPAPAEEAEVEVRIVRPRHGSAEAHAAMSPVLHSAGKMVHIDIRIGALVTHGRMSETELLLWVENALNHYHRFRLGYVGYGMTAGIKQPRVRRAKDSG